MTVDKGLGAAGGKRAADVQGVLGGKRERRTEDVVEGQGSMGEQRFRGKCSESSLGTQGQWSRLLEFLGLGKAGGYSYEE